jgi:hypothetical protein
MGMLDSNHFSPNCDLQILHLSILSEHLPHALQLFKTGSMACKKLLQINDHHGFVVKILVVPCALKFRTQ